LDRLISVTPGDLGIAPGQEHHLAVRLALRRGRLLRGWFRGRLAGGALLGHVDPPLHGVCGLAGTGLSVRAVRERAGTDTCLADTCALSNLAPCLNRPHSRFRSTSRSRCWPWSRRTATTLPAGGRSHPWPP